MDESLFTKAFSLLEEKRRQTKKELSAQALPVVEELLKLHDKPSLSLACSVADKLACAHPHYAVDDETGVQMKLKCAREALSQKDYGTSFVMARSAGIDAAKLADREKLSRESRAAKLRDEIVSFLYFDLGKAKGLPAGIDAKGVARALIGFDTDYNVLREPLPQRERASFARHRSRANLLGLAT